MKKIKIHTYFIFDYIRLDELFFTDFLNKIFSKLDRHLESIVTLKKIVRGKRAFTKTKF